MSNYVHTLLEQTFSYTCYLSELNFTPRKAGRGEETAFSRQLASSVASDGSEEVQGLDSISVEQKEALLERLHHGQGNLTLQEWDDFLADLVDLDLITNTDRMYANGILKDIPQEALHGAYFVSHGDSLPDDLQPWKGDPIQWLDDVDLYLLKKGLLAEIERKSAAGVSNQRDSCKKVAQIVQELLA